MHRIEHSDIKIKGVTFRAEMLPADEQGIKWVKVSPIVIPNNRADDTLGENWATARPRGGRVVIASGTGEEGLDYEALGKAREVMEMVESHFTRRDRWTVQRHAPGAPPLAEDEARLTHEIYLSNSVFNDGRACGLVAKFLDEHRDRAGGMGGV